MHGVRARYAFLCGKPASTKSISPGAVLCYSIPLLYPTTRRKISWHSRLEWSERQRALAGDLLKQSKCTLFIGIIIARRPAPPSASATRPCSRRVIFQFRFFAAHMCCTADNCANSCVRFLNVNARSFVSDSSLKHPVQIQRVSYIFLFIFICLVVIT